MLLKGMKLPKLLNSSKDEAPALTLQPHIIQNENIWYQVMQLSENFYLEFYTTVSIKIKNSQAALLCPLLSIN